MNTVTEPINFLFQTLDPLPIPCVSTDLSGRVVRVNRVAAAEFGRLESAMVGRVAGSDDLPWPELPGLDWQRQFLWWGASCIGHLHWPERRGGSVAAVPKLTKQRKAVLDLLQRGQSVKEIANDLGLKEATVRTHIFRLRQLLGGSDLLSLRYLDIPGAAAAVDEASRRKII